MPKGLASHSVGRGKIRRNNISPLGGPAAGVWSSLVTKSGLQGLRGFDAPSKSACRNWGGRGFECRQVHVNLSTKYELTDHPNERGICYVAGPMSLYGPEGDWGYPLFEEMAYRLRRAGYEVIAPNELHGPDDAPPDTDWDEGWSWSLRRDISQLVKAGVVVLLPRWEESRGARLEHSIAHALGMRIIYPGWDTEAFIAGRV